MLTADTKLISVDDHVVEPPGVFVDHIAPRYRDRAPRITEPEPGVQGWEWEGRFYPLMFQGNVHTRRFRAGEEGKGQDLFARHYDDMIPAAYDVHERVRAMDEDGVWAELLFPTFPRFGGNRFLEADDPELALACVQAWNEWMLDEWCAAYPDRFIPQTLIPLWDPQLAAREIERCAAKGSKAISFVENPYPIGLPSFPTGHWDPVFAAAADTGLPLSMHIGTSSGLISPSPETTRSVGIALCGMNSMSALGDLIFSGALESHPDVPDRAVGRRRRLGAVRAGAPRLHLATQPLRRRQLQPVAVRGVRAALLGVHGRRSLRGDQPRPDRSRQAHVGVRLPAQRLQLSRQP